MCKETLISNGIENFSIWKFPRDSWSIPTVANNNNSRITKHINHVICSPFSFCIYAVLCCAGAAGALAVAVQCELGCCFF